MLLYIENFVKPFLALKAYTVIKYTVFWTNATIKLGSSKLQTGDSFPEKPTKNSHQAFC